MSRSRDGARGAETRERIIAAARVVMLDRGLVRATTKEIARVAGVSEGTLYNYFVNKQDLFHATLSRLPSGFFALVQGLHERSGSDPASAVLAEVAHSALDFYGEAIPMGASFFADPELLGVHRELLAERGAGPQKANEAVAAFLLAEQQLGRVRADADPTAAAYMLLGAIYQYVYWRAFLGTPKHPEADERFINGLLESISLTLFPARELT